MNNTPLSLCSKKKSKCKRVSSRRNLDCLPSSCRLQCEMVLPSERSIIIKGFRPKWLSPLYIMFQIHHSGRESSISFRPFHQTCTLSKPQSRLPCRSRASGLCWSHNGLKSLMLNYQIWTECTSERGPCIECRTTHAQYIPYVNWCCIAIHAFHGMPFNSLHVNTNSNRQRP